MEYYVNSKIEEETIYEIYKACRLCGAGAGYKMPIIQNVVNLAPDEIELKQKIRECVQIEVHQDDKMPPLICELCVDKVNDFYEFLDMCQQTNKKTRLRLGLPPQTLPRGAPDAGDCILGITEPVFINNDSNEPILTRNSKSKNKFKKESERRVEVDKKALRRETRKDSKTTKIISANSLRSRHGKEPSPPSLRGNKRLHEDDNVALSKLLRKRKPDTQYQQPKSILKKVKTDDFNVEVRSKRSSGSRKAEFDNKRVKISLSVSPKSSKEGKSRLVRARSPPPPRPGKPRSSPPRPPSFKCPVCKVTFKTNQALQNHSRTHATSTARRVGPTKTESKSRTCNKCEKKFTSLDLLKIHKCTWKQVCKACRRTFMTKQALISHEKTCSQTAPAKNTARRTGRPQSHPVKISPELKSMLKPLRVRTARCDKLLDRGNRCNSAAVPHNFGLDDNYVYPFLNNSLRKVRIKTELSEYDSMVNIQDEIRDEFDFDENYVHWDSVSETDSDTDVTDAATKKSKVHSLLTLSLKTIYSPKLLGKVPRKLRRIKCEKPFDSILNSSEMDADIRRGIDNIINSLDDTRNEEDLLNLPSVANSYFDFISSTKDAILDVSENKDNNEGNPETNNEDTISVINDKADECNLDLSNISDIATSSTETNIGESVNLVNKIREESVNGIAFATEDGNISQLDEKQIENDDEISISKEIDRIEQIKPIEKEPDIDKEIESIKEEETIDTEEDIGGKEDKESESADENKSVLDEKEKEEAEEKEISSIDSKEVDDTITKLTESDYNELDRSDFNDRNDDKEKKVNGETEIPDKFNVEDLEDISDTDMDDKSLMEALDAQIGDEVKTVDSVREIGLSEEMAAVKDKAVDETGY